jgi:hypothetical protein
MSQKCYIRILSMPCRSQTATSQCVRFGNGKCVHAWPLLQQHMLLSLLHARLYMCNTARRVPTDSCSFPRRRLLPAAVQTTMVCARSTQSLIHVRLCGCDRLSRVALASRGFPPLPFSNLKGGWSCTTPAQPALGAAGPSLLGVPGLVRAVSGNVCMLKCATTLGSCFRPWPVR